MSEWMEKICKKKNVKKEVKKEGNEKEFKKWSEKKIYDKNMPRTKVIDANLKNNKKRKLNLITFKADLVSAYSTQYSCDRYCTSKITGNLIS